MLHAASKQHNADAAVGGCLLFYSMGFIFCLLHVFAVCRLLNGFLSCVQHVVLKERDSLCVS